MNTLDPSDRAPDGIPANDGQPIGQSSGLRIRPLDEVIPLVQAAHEQVSAELGIPTKAAFEDSFPEVPAFYCDPFLMPDEFLARSEGAQAILVASFATGTIPDRLVPAMQQRLSEGVPIFVVSNNPGENFGITKITYAAGEEAYKSGAIALQKVNINHHREVKATILVEALGRGLRGQELAREIEQRYAFQEGEAKPVAEWDQPEFVLPPASDIGTILRQSGFTDAEGNYIPFRP